MKFLSLSIITMVLVLGEIPYNTTNKPQPAGTDFKQLIPAKVGSFTRLSYKDPAPGLDGEATYRSGTKEIFMLFSKADTQKDLAETMQTIREEIKLCGLCVFAGEVSHKDTKATKMFFLRSYY